METFSFWIGDIDYQKREKHCDEGMAFVFYLHAVDRVPLAFRTLALGIALETFILSIYGRDNIQYNQEKRKEFAWDNVEKRIEYLITKQILRKELLQPTNDYSSRHLLDVIRDWRNKSAHAERFSIEEKDFECLLHEFAGFLQWYVNRYRLQGWRRLLIKKNYPDNPKFDYGKLREDLFMSFDDEIDKNIKSIDVRPFLIFIFTLLLIIFLVGIYMRFKEAFDESGNGEIVKNEKNISDSTTNNKAKIDAAAIRVNGIDSSYSGPPQQDIDDSKLTKDYPASSDSPVATNQPETHSASTQGSIPFHNSKTNENGNKIGEVTGSSESLKPEKPIKGYPRFRSYVDKKEQDSLGVLAGKRALRELMERKGFVRYSDPLTNPFGNGKGRIAFLTNCSNCIWDIYVNGEYIGTTKYFTTKMPFSCFDDVFVFKDLDAGYYSYKAIANFNLERIILSGNDIYIDDGKCHKQWLVLQK